MSQDTVRCLTLEYCAQILSGLQDSDLKTCALGTLLSGDHTSLVGLEIDPSRYLSASSFFDDYIAVSLLSKYPYLDLGINREEVAFKKFLESEVRCSKASESLIAIRRGKVNILDPVHAVLHSARQKIERLLGPFNWDHAEQFFNFSAGACVGLPRKRGDSAYKYGQEWPTATAGTAGLAAVYIKTVPVWWKRLTSDTSDTPNLRIVQGNRITTVPKNAKTDRVIAIEPCLNMFFQKGIGGLIRKQLRRVNVDLNSQSLNQSLAREGSIDGSLATVDLRSASDCISTTLVEELLPTDWVSAIKRCRSPYGILPNGEKIYYQKVSSMGNGYTFELESLIFWAVSSSVMSFLGESDRRLAIYGDDIVLPTGCANLLIDVLSRIGFDTNTEKTFVSGPFRESCGKHYFRGVDVTPIYVRERIDGTERLIWFCNSVRRLAFRLNGSSWSCDSRLRWAYDEALSALPINLRSPSIPVIGVSNEMSDLAIAGDFDEVAPVAVKQSHKEARRNWRPCLEGFVATGFRRVYKKLTLCHEGVLLKGLRSLDYKEDYSTSTFYQSGFGVSFPRDWLVRDWCAVLSNLPEARQISASVGVSAAEIPRQLFSMKKFNFVVQRWGNVGPWL